MVAILLFAILKSALYSLLALGFTLLFGVGGVLNLAHGALLMISAYLTYTGFEVVGLPLSLALVGGVLVTAGLAAALYRGVIGRIQHSSILTLIVTLAIALMAQEAIALIFGTSATLPNPVPGQSRIAGIEVANVQLAAFAVAWLAIGGFWVFIERTRFGKAIRATAMDAKGAALVGIHSRQVFTWTWALSGGLAGLAGVFLVYPSGLSPTMWIDPLVIAFAIVILGGLGSLKGSIVAAYLVGFVETLTFYAPQVEIPLGAQWVGVPSLLLTVLILIIRPQGLFGRPAT
ncbi:MAG: branched-chain amino acid ABC transporter permease [Candidatus Bipolaricaulia bacterium]